MKKILLMSLFLLSVLLQEAMAQNRTITGKVTDGASANGLPGVTIVVKGTQVGTATDINGGYSITIPAGGTTLAFSFVGYLPVDRPIGNASVINVSLAADVRQLDEIIVTGQGVGIEKKRLSTTVDVITAEDLRRTPTVRLDQVLQSKLPSAQIQLSSGQPGTASIIRSRGVSSAQGSTTPVIYIDGVRADNLNTGSALGLDTGGGQSSALSDLPVENIERIEFIRGGAATTLYGADAANGVIQIFTKKGTAGPGRVTLETQLGTTRGTRDFLHYKETADYLYKPGMVQSYRLGFDGGNEAVTYSFSGNMMEDEGFRPNNTQTRYNLRGSVSAKVNNKTRYTGSAGFSRNAYGRDFNGNTSWSTFGNLEQGGLGTLNELTGEEQAELKDYVNNIQALLNHKEFVNRFQTSHSVEYKPIEKVTLNAVVGLDSRNSQEKQIVTNALDIALGNSANNGKEGYIDVSTRNFMGLTGSLNGQYKEEVGNFSFITTLGSQFFRNEDRQFLLNATEVAEGSQSVNAAKVVGEDYISTLTSYGFYGQENIGFKNRYFVEFGLRADGNSAFGEDIGLQLFPKVGVSYDVSSEEYFQIIPAKIVSNLKLRANYGEAGNFPPAFSRDRLIQVNPYNSGTSYTFGNPGDPDLKPERTKTMEVGGDLGLFSNRLNLSVTFYNAKTVDALFNAPFAPSTGQNAQTRNLGEIENKGFELAINTTIVNNDDFKLNYSASINKNKNVVLSSGGAPEFSIGGFAFLGAFVKEGQPVGYFRGRIPTFDDAGNVASTVNNAFLGSAQPDLFGNTTLSATLFSRLTIDISGTYQLGAQGVNLDETIRYFNGVQDGRIPASAAENEADYTKFGALWVEDNDFFKVRNISAFYRVPESLYGKAFKGIELGFNALNPFNFVQSTFDPEVTGAGASNTVSGQPTQGRITVGGFGYATESAPRQLLGTLRLTF
jgi:TonB-dependent SusC/RagA subfamily outer membrane receptor